MAYPGEKLRAQGVEWYGRILNPGNEEIFIFVKDVRICATFVADMPDPEQIVLKDEAYLSLKNMRAGAFYVEQLRRYADLPLVFYAELCKWWPKLMGVAVQTNVCTCSSYNLFNYGCKSSRGLPCDNRV